MSTPGYDERDEFPLDDGYELTDPKHPDFHDLMSGVWDDRDKTVAPPDGERPA